MKARVSNTDIYEIIYTPPVGDGKNGVEGGAEGGGGKMGAVEAGLYARSARRTSWGEPV
jgi:hypothetical protein